MNIKELIEKYEYLNHNYFRRVDTSEILKDLRQLDEPQKVKIPQYIADKIEYCKESGDWDLFQAMDYCFNFRECSLWLENSDNQELFARAWIEGYEVEKEKRYLVKVKGVNEYGCYLNKGSLSKEYFLESKAEISGCRTKHTRKQLEEDGFGWVFDCEGIEIEEVE